MLSCSLTIVAYWRGYTKHVYQAASLEASANWKVKHANLLASMTSNVPVLQLDIKHCSTRCGLAPACGEHALLHQDIQTRLHRCRGIQH